MTKNVEIAPTVSKHLFASWRYHLTQRPADFFCTGPGGEYFAFAGQMISVTVVQLRHCEPESHSKCHVKDWAGLCPVTFDLQKQAANEDWPKGYSLPSPDLTHDCVLHVFYEEDSSFRSWVGSGVIFCGKNALWRVSCAHLSHHRKVYARCPAGGDAKNT